jgi:hypothetical protein
MLKYFYHNPIKGYDVPSDEATSLDKEYTTDMFYDTIGDEPGSYFGAISQDDVTIQFYLEDHDERIRIEVPVPMEQGSYAKYVNFDEALEIIKNLKDNFSLKDFPGLKYESWQ